MLGRLAGKKIDREFDLPVLEEGNEAGTQVQDDKSGNAVLRKQKIINVAE